MFPPASVPVMAVMMALPPPRPLEAAAAYPLPAFVYKNIYYPYGATSIWPVRKTYKKTNCFVLLVIRALKLFFCFLEKKNSLLNYFFIFNVQALFTLEGA